MWTSSCVAPFVSKPVGARPRAVCSLVVGCASLRALCTLDKSQLELASGLCVHWTKSQLEFASGLCAHWTKSQLELAPGLVLTGPAGGWSSHQGHGL